MNNLAIFASGNGSNAEAISDFFLQNNDVRIQIILTNNPKAGVIDRAHRLGLECKVFSRDDFYNSENVLNILKKYDIDFIVLAGFLWLIPSSLINAFPNKIVNIHPALLPKYGGKGMYGMNVHKAVRENNETESGITIHYVNEEYDKGDIIFQARCIINKDDSPEDIAQKVHALEYEHFPKVIEGLVSK